MQVISEGTLRPQDLIPAFLNAVQEYAPAHYEGFMVMPFGPVPQHALEDASADWWDSEQPQYLLEELTEILEQHAPDGEYFGTLEGDGACFGFFPADE